MKLKIISIGVVLAVLSSCGIVSKTRYGNGLHLDLSFNKGAANLPRITKNYKPVKQNCRAKLQPVKDSVAVNLFGDSKPTASENLPSFVNQTILSPLKKENEIRRFLLKDKSMLRSDDLAKKIEKTKEKKPKKEREKLDNLVLIALVFSIVGLLGALFLNPVLVFGSFVWVSINFGFLMFTGLILAAISLIKFRMERKVKENKRSKKYAWGIILGFFYAILLLALYSLTRF